MTKKKLLLTDKISTEAFLTLNQQSYFEVEKSPFPGLEQSDLSGVHGLLIRSRTPITEDILKGAKQLQVIVSATSGFDHLDLAACQKWGITVMHTPNANIDSAAELTWALVLACARNLSAAQKMTKSGEWRNPLAPGFELSGKSYGIIGLGRIGLRVAEIARAFHMNILSYDPFQEEAQFQKAFAERLALEELLKKSDVISLHVPLTKETTGMIGPSQFEYMNRGAILVNTSRGPVIREEDLVHALQQGWLSAAGLDVYEKEPPSRNSPLFQLPNLALTPHIGAHTGEAFAKASELAVLKLIQFFIDGSTSDTLPPKGGWYGAVRPW